MTAKLITLKRHLKTVAWLGLFFATAVAAQGAAPKAPATGEPPPVLATVNGVEIGADQFGQRFSGAARNKFYHSNPPEAEINAFRHQVLREMIDDILLDAEVARRKLRPDAVAVDAEIDKYERQYRDSAQWQQNRDSLLPGLRAGLEARNRRERLRETVQDVPAPKPAEVERYYREKPELFTEPERVRVSIILLGVDPSSPSAVWKAAYDEATRIREEIGKGRPFADLARLHSTHVSAERGGDMGYLHAGMLPEAESAVASLAANEVSQPLRVLEGIALIRLDERVPAKLRAFADVRQRAGELLLRDRRESAWREFTEGLYQRAKVSLDAKRFPDFASFPLPGNKPGK